jgi:hypothetical protein
LIPFLLVTERHFTLVPLAPRKMKRHEVLD